MQVALLVLLAILLVVRCFFRPAARQLRAAEAAARAKQASNLRRAEVARITARAEFDVEAVERGIREYSWDVAAVAGELADDVIAERRFGELRQILAKRVGMAVSDIVAIEADVREPPGHQPDNLVLAADELQKRETLRDAVKARVRNRRCFVEKLQSTIESLATEASNRFVQHRKHLDGAFALIQLPSEGAVADRVRAVLSQSFRARQRWNELMAPLEDGRSPLEIPPKEDDMFRLPDFGRLEIRRFGLESRSVMEVRLVDELTSALGDYEAQVDQLFAAELAVSEARKDFDQAIFFAERRKQSRDQQLIELFSRSRNPTVSTGLLQTTKLPKRSLGRGSRGHRAVSI